MAPKDLVDALQREAAIARQDRDRRALGLAHAVVAGGAHELELLVAPGDDELDAGQTLCVVVDGLDDDGLEAGIDDVVAEVLGPKVSAARPSGELGERAREAPSPRTREVG